MKKQTETMLEEALGRRPASLQPLSGGCVGTVYLARMPDGERLVVKVDTSAEAQLGVEGAMLRYLAEHTTLPVPEVFVSDDQLLVMAYVEGGGGGTAAAERHAAELLAELHGHGAEAYGFEWDTLIGALPQPNPWTASWPSFFAEHRLLYMGRLALEAGRMGTGTLARLEALCGRIDAYIEAPAAPALVHGDVWSGNVLFGVEQVAAFIDPAIYFADPEVELAFIGLFHTFGEAFYETYDALRPIPEGFFEVRRDLYNLYPLLVHVRLFGGSYLASVERILDRLG